MVKQEIGMSDTKYGEASTDCLRSTADELRMEWAEAVNTVDEALEFYYEHVRDTPVDSDYDRNDVGTVQRAWQRIQQG